MNIFELIQNVWLFFVLTMRKKLDETVFVEHKIFYLHNFKIDCVYTTNWLSKKANTEINEAAMILNLV